MRFHFTSAVLTALSLAANSVQAAEYNYPYHDPYVATATTAILAEDGAGKRPKSNIVHVPGIPGRNDLPTLEGRGDCSIALYRRDDPAPLLFILAGLGANPFFGVAPYLASLFYREGFHVVILPSPMSWNFALSASRSGVPGYAPEDARDLYEAMQKTLTTLKERYDVKTTKINVMAVSLGALEGAYLSAVEADEKKIGIAKYLLVNPPIDLAYGVKKLDQWNALRSKFGRTKSQELVSRAIAIVDSLSEERLDDPKVFARLARQFSGFTTEELQFLIAETLESQLPELVYASQVMHDQNVLSAPKGDMRQRLEEAKTFNLTNYIQKIAVPIWQRRAQEPTVDAESFLRRGSLAPILDRLRANPKVQIMHNADDFLADKKSLEKLKEALGSQMTLYPYGGHLGNLWYSVNKADVLSFFRHRG